MLYVFNPEEKCASATYNSSMQNVDTTEQTKNPFQMGEHLKQKCENIQMLSLRGGPSISWKISEVCVKTGEKNTDKNHD